MTRCLLISIIISFLSLGVSAQYSSTAKLGVALHHIQGLQIKSASTSELNIKAPNIINNLEVLSVGQHVVKVMATKHNVAQVENQIHNNLTILPSTALQALTTLISINSEVYTSLIKSNGPTDGMPLVMYTIEAF